MFDTASGWKIGVEVLEPEGSYIILPAVQLAVVCRLLTEHSIPHAVEGAVPNSRHHADEPSESVVRLGFAVDVTHVQDLLDSAR
jgi:hypothetical protein